MAKDVAVKKDTVPAEQYDYGKFANRGFEDVSSKDLAIPFLSVLQAQSPAVQDQIIPGSEAGNILNSVTGEIMSQPVTVLPVHHENVWVEWVPRAKGGGIAGRHAPNSPLIKSILENNGGSNIPPLGPDGVKRIPFTNPETGNELVDTQYMYCLIVDKDVQNVETFCIVPFTSTKIKAYKNWFTCLYGMKRRGAPIFASPSCIRTVKQKNAQGSFFNFDIKPPEGETWQSSMLLMDDRGISLMEEADNFYEQIMAGIARPADESLSGEAPEVSGEGNEIPF
jgi:hypothetical protein